MKRLILFAIYLLPSIAFAQTPAKTPIYVDCTCEDPVGSLYATALRDAIAASPRFTEVYVAEVIGEDKKPASYNWVLSIVSVDENNPQNGTSSAFSVVMKLGSTFFYSHWVQTCGRERVPACAASTLANFDSMLHR